ncbi:MULTISPECIES: hypothetical protein [Microbacterium]|uniref:hypothetical protein n=1 Tax=Microbacterium TaxID=33882 RepID=UPI00034ECBA1|nr:MULTISPECIES: hypothetical protein [Microbacterium]EPD84063.1 hypothetical protein HMPREF1529_02103 [Microbacterium sp. oral taxon 186 str. F0373]
MSTPIAFNETDHPRGQASNAGQFRAKENAAPAMALTVDEAPPESIYGNVSSTIIFQEANDRDDSFEIERAEINVARILDGLDFEDLPETVDDYDRTDGLFRWAANYGYIAEHGGPFEVILDDAELESYRAAREKSGRMSALHPLPTMTEQEREAKVAQLLSEHLPEGGLNALYSWDIDQAARWAWDTRQEITKATIQRGIQQQYLSDETRTVLDRLQNAALTAYQNTRKDTDIAVIRAAAYGIYEHLARRGSH